jgi:hypothetical protein
MDNYPDYETVEYHLVYAELIHAARHRGTVTYQELAHIVGLPLTGNYMGKRIGELLGAVSQNQLNRQRPLLSAVAIGTSGVPGEGFFGLAEELGLLTTGEDRLTFWEKQRTACYQIWKQQFPKK